jgi:hypothetical protein
MVVVILLLPQIADRFDGTLSFYFIFLYFGCVHP